MSDTPADVPPDAPIVSRYGAQLRASDNAVVWVTQVSDDNATQFFADHGMTEISADVFSQLCVDTGVVWGVQNGMLIQLPAPPVDVARIAKVAQTKLSDRAEGLRLQVLSGGATMAVVYAAKLREADAVRAVVTAGGTPVAANYPLLRAEVGFTAPTLAGVATAVLTRSLQVDTWLAGSEIIRLRAKAAIAAAKTQADIDAALDAVAWPALPA